jgi:sulfate/thiosulfate transport system permease protein
VVKVSTPVRWLLRVIAVGYVFFLVAWPVSLVAVRTFENGTADFFGIFTDPHTVAALQLTLMVAVWAVVINLVFGVTISLLLVRYDFPGKRVLSALIDLPLSVSPVVVGLALLLVFSGRTGWFGPSIEQAGWQVIYDSPGMIMATCFVALPLIIREVVPVLSEIGDDQEQAARSLGASGRQTFLRITLPSIKWAVIYGVVLSLARSLGEFGAVKVVSGNITGRTQTATLIVEAKYQNFEQGTAYSVAFLLAFISIACLIVVAFLRPKHEEA